jgi:predicted ATPase/class 3 adenylate cyclase
VTAAVGVRGFLFSDLEGSTRLLEELRTEAYGRLLAVYHRMVTEATAATGGEVVDREGDGLFCVFPTAGAALSAAVSAQQAMGREPWPGGVTVRARMGVHVGEVSLGEAGYVGMEIHRAARVAQAAWGGQILVSEIARTLASEREGFSFDDLGPHRLKDLTEPLRLYVLAGPGLSSGFPPPRTLEAHRHNLPVQLSSFVGRDQELAEVAKLLRGSRLVTLTGVGGSGKTRLALQAGADMVSEFADGVWLIDLAPVSEPELVAQQIAAVLGIREQANRSLMDGLKEHLGSKELLLLVDNCEHLIDAINRVVGDLLGGTDKIRVLATSREPLHLPGEVSYRVPSLRVPATVQGFDPRVLGSFDAVRLFVARAESVRPAFRLTSKNSGAVVEICRRLDGIPLAIELAAARLASFSPEQIASHLDQRFRLLSGSRRGGLPRHDTLQATIDWSYALLDEQEQQLFRRLAVFRSDFSLEAAQRIVAGEGLDEMDLLELLPRLIDKSLVLAEPAEGEMRYRLLETIREYGAERLSIAGEIDQFQTRHVSYYLQLAEETEPNLQSAKQADAEQMLEAEHDNLRQALRWALDTRQTDAAYRLAGALSTFWYGSSHTVEGRQWLAAVLDLPGPVDELIRARVLHGAGVCASSQGDQAEALEYLQAAVEIYRRTGNVHQLELGDALLSLARFVHYQQADFNWSELLYLEALENFRRIDQWRVARTLGNLVSLALDKGDVERAQGFNQEHLVIARDLGSLQLGIAFDSSSAIREYTGDIKSVPNDLQQAAENYQAAGDHYRACVMRAHLALAHLESGSVDLANREFISNAGVLLANPEHHSLAGPVAELAVIRVGLEIEVDHAERAAILIGAIRRMVDDGAHIGALSNILSRYEEATKSLMGADAFESALGRGAALTNEEVRSLVGDSISQAVTESA